MRRIYSVIAMFVVLLFLIVGASIYVLASSQIQQSKNQATQAIAEGVALSLSKQLILLQELVDALAQSPEAVAAFATADPVQLQHTAVQLEKYLPGVLKIRLLLPGSQSQDNDTPVMGYADMDMVRESLTTQQLPAVHDQDANKHLAVAARTLKNNLAIGVLLASINPAMLNKSMQEIAFNEGYLKLMQGPLPLFERGDSALKNTDTGKIAVPNTRWEVHFSSAKIIDSSFQWVVAVIVFAGIILSGLGFFIAFRYLDNLFSKDCATLIKVMKDLLNGKVSGNYPTNLAEMRVIISTLVQFRRVVDENGQEKHSSALNAAKLNDFLDEPEGFDFQESNQGVANRSPHLVGKAIGLQQLEDTPQATLPVLMNTNPAQRTSIFKAFDIRGIIDRTLTKDMVYSIGQAYGSEAKAQGIQRIIMGYDGRLSGPVMAEALAKGIITTGVDVLDIGMVPTPVMYFVTHHSEGHSGIMITGSHNPAQYNGLKMLLNGATLIGDGIQQLKRRIDAEDYSLAALGNIERNSRYTNEYIGTLSEDIHIVRPMKVVLDCANGVTGALGPKLLRTLGCEVIELFCEVDGNFPNHLPDPGRPENLGDLIAAVQHYHADIGIAFDGDGDQLGVVDSHGKIIRPDRLMMLFAKDVLEARSGAQVIYDVSCSKHLGEQILKFGGRPLISKAGDTLIRAKIKETGAKLAGEISGHIFFNDRWFGFDDALYAASRLIQILSADPRSSAELFASFPDSVCTPEIIVELAEGENLHLIEMLRKTVTIKDAKILDLDGLRYDFADGCCSIRASKSRPALLLRFEADSKEVLERIQRQFKTGLLSIKPDINLSF